VVHQIILFSARKIIDKMKLSKKTAYLCINIALLFLSINACSSSSDNNNNDDGMADPDTVIVPDQTTISLSVEACKAQERIIGKWEMDEVNDSGVALKGIQFFFSHFGTFSMSAREAKSNVYATLSGLYKVIDANHLSITYRDLITRDLIRKDAEFSIEDDSLILKLPGDPQYYAIRQSMEEGPLEDWYTRQNPYRTDGICELSQMVAPTGGHLTGCIEDDIHGTWYLVMPEKNGNDIADSISFTSYSTSTNRGRFYWNYITKYFHDSAETTPTFRESGTDDNYQPRYIDHGTYTLKNDGTIYLDYDNFPSSNKPHYQKKIYAITYDKPFLTLTDESGTEFFFLRNRENDEQLDDDIYGSLKERKEDGICEGEAFEGCPAQHLIGRWTLPSRYKDKLEGFDAYLFNEEYPFLGDESYPLNGFDWIVFYDDGTAHFYHDNGILYEFNYEVFPFGSYSDYPWKLRFFMDDELVDDEGNIERVVRNQYSRIAVSEQAIIFQFRYEQPNGYRYDHVVLQKINSGDAMGLAQCVEAN
jgi:hypothetical protein